MNEPRSGKANGAREIQSWITEVAPYAKWFAPHQLITVGEDGFYQSSNCQAYSCAALCQALPACSR
jgi:mannan endo-1,4-beta-mannosidase